MFLRGSQAGQVGGLLAIPISMVLGSIAITVPIVLGGGLMILLAGFLALTMAEDGFTPTPPEDRTTWGMMLKSAALARVLMWNAGLIVLALAGFGLTRTFWIALLLYWSIGVFRSTNGPLYSTCFNQRIDDPQVRATMFSVGQPGGCRRPDQRGGRSPVWLAICPSGRRWSPLR